MKIAAVALVVAGFIPCVPAQTNPGVKLTKLSAASDQLVAGLDENHFAYVWDGQAWAFVQQKMSSVSVGSKSEI